MDTWTSADAAKFLDSARRRFRRRYLRRQIMEGLLLGICAGLLIWAIVLVLSWSGR